ncbi:hypothetical protein [Bradyrhizobium lablabi]|nr:hypothetical protein [Bradyrhizobium lablabi]
MTARRHDWIAIASYISIALTLLSLVVLFTAWTEPPLTLSG